MSDLGFAIVVVGYNRLKCMKRLLDSLNNVDYKGDEISLYISIDKSNTNVVEQYANDFVWKYGDKIVLTYPERLGLKNHILKCGDILSGFDAIAVFEDDIVVSPAFYNFMKQAVNYYYEDMNIAGISLYTYMINENTSLPFIPDNSSADVFSIQFAQSWGQVWLKRQWFEFKRWIEDNNIDMWDKKIIPEFVYKWPKTSWLKYHIYYCIEQNKKYIYPYLGTTTCYSEVGEHCNYRNSNYQIPMCNDTNKTYRFVSTNDTDMLVEYDAFFERIGLGKYLSIPESELCVDLYGSKNHFSDKKYLLTTNLYKYNAINNYDISLRPHESSVINEVYGEGITLYEIDGSRKRYCNNLSETKRYMYHFKIEGLSKKMLFILLSKILYKTILRRRV